MFCQHQVRDLAKADSDFWALHWVPEEKQPWGSWKGTRAGSQKTKPCQYPSAGCWGLECVWFSSAFPLSPVGSVSGPSSALSSSPRGESTRRKLPLVLSEASPMQIFLLEICQAFSGRSWCVECSGFASKRSQRSWLHGGVHGTQRAEDEAHWAYSVLAVLMTFMSFLHSGVPRYWKVAWRNIARVNANLACVHQDFLICQSLVEHRGKICRIFRGKWMYWHFASNFVNPFER